MVFLSTFLLEIFIRVYICNIYKMNLILRGGREEETFFFKKKKGKMVLFFILRLKCVQALSNFLVQSSSLSFNTYSSL